MGASGRKLTFIDLFAGAGGLSLGLMQAGLIGLFAAEKEANAFSTLKANLIDRPNRFSYAWPDWLPREPLDIARLLKDYRHHLEELKGRVDVLAGGPPCQGFSSAGRRVQQDPRNHLFKLYAEVAEALQPPFLVFENVPGIAEVFDKQDRRFRNPTRIGRPPVPYSERIAKKLGQLGYEVVGLHERAVDFGVPQNRTRYLMVGVHRATGLSISPDLVRGLLATHRNDLLRELELVGPITLQEAISDLETHGRRLIPCVDSLGFNQLDYQGPLTQYQRIMRDGATEAPNSMRLANQRPDTVARLAQILATCRKDVRLLPSEREALGIGKQSITPLAPNRPAKTVTSLPDDFIHYSEPRILTVRECARIQSFPDWFSFHGKYTTGGPKRTVEVPRYTQVANAVPPLLARVVGLTLQHLHSQIAVADSREEQFVPAALTV